MSSFYPDYASGGGGGVGGVGGGVDPDYVSGGGGGVGGVGGGVDPDYVSGGGGDAGGVEKKVLAVFEREFAVAIQQVEMIKDMIAIQDGKKGF